MHKADNTTAEPLGEKNEVIIIITYRQNINESQNISYGQNIKPLFHFHFKGPDVVLLQLASKLQMDQHQELLANASAPLPLPLPHATAASIHHISTAPLHFPGLQPPAIRLLSAGQEPDVVLLQLASKFQLNQARAGEVSFSSMRRKGWCKKTFFLDLVLNSGPPHPPRHVQDFHRTFSKINRFSPPKFFDKYDIKMTQNAI